MHPKTIIKMDDVSKKWRKSVENEKTIGNALPANKMGQVDELLMFVPKVSNDNGRDSVFLYGSKLVRQRFLSVEFVLNISSFGI